MKPDPLHEAQRARCLHDREWKYTRADETDIRKLFERLSAPKESKVTPINSARKELAK